MIISYVNILNMFYKYKYSKKEELELITNNFNINAKNYNDIYYSISLKQLRKIKIFTIDGNLKLKKIIEKSKKVNAEDVLLAILSFDLSTEIDKEIIRNIINLNNYDYEK